MIISGWKTGFLKAGLPALLVLLACSAGGRALAQGYQFQPWDARQSVPSLVAADLNGQVWRLSELKGRAVLLNFWASWCEPCLAEMPSLQALADLQGPQKLLVLAVNFKQPLPIIQNFVQRTALQLPVLPDPQGLLARQWGIKVFPSTVLIDATGRVHGIVRGELDWSGSAARHLLQPLIDVKQKHRRCRDAAHHLGASAAAPQDGQQTGHDPQDPCQTP